MVFLNSRNSPPLEGWIFPKEKDGVVKTVQIKTQHNERNFNSYQRFPYP